MKHILFYIIHKTLTLEHCDLTFKSISSQCCNKKFDYMYIYNSCYDEIPNESILLLYEEYNLNLFFDCLKIFPYDSSTHKSLGGDINAICSYVKNNYEHDDRILFLKSDCILSKNYFKEIFNIQSSEPIYFTAPFINAKKRVPNNEIIEYSIREKYIPYDEITFFVEDRYQSNNNCFHNRKYLNVNDECIKFFSCYVIRDWSCHLITVSLLDLLNINNQSWGGVSLSKLEPYFINTDNCFVIHKYHNIQSQNCNKKREGPVEEWMNS